MTRPAMPTNLGNEGAWGPILTAAIYALSDNIDALTKTVTGLTANQGTTAPTGGTSTPQLNNLWKSPQQVDTFAKGQTELAPIAAQPQAKWVLGTETQAQIAALATAAAGKTITLCVYAIPGRDNGQYSAGGLASADAYLGYIRTIIAGLGTAPAFVIVEPDALGFTSQLSGQTRTDRATLIRQTLALFAAVPTIECYVDIATWATNPADVLAEVQVGQIKGFSVNVAGFISQANCYTFSDALVSQLASAKGISGMKYLVDSSRNGNGELTTSFPGSKPWFDIGQPWCNPPGRAIGLLPGYTDAAHPAMRASLWIKSPGETDGSFPQINQSGYYGASAPAAGTFWPPAARDLLGLAPFIQGTPDTSKTFSNVTSTFDSWGPFTGRSSGSTLVGGRGRMPVTTAYETIGTLPAWSLVGSRAAARIFAAPVPGGSTTCETNMQIEAPTVGTRLRIKIDTKTGQVSFSNEVGYYDQTAVSIGYDSVQMAYFRIREASGKTYFETSQDKSSWTIRSTVTSPSWVHAAADQALNFVTHSDVAGTYSEIDDVNA